MRPRTGPGTATVQGTSTLPEVDGFTMPVLAGARVRRLTPFRLLSRLGQRNDVILPPALLSQDLHSLRLAIDIAFGRQWGAKIVIPNVSCPNDPGCFSVERGKGTARRESACSHVRLGHSCGLSSFQLSGHMFMIRKRDFTLHGSRG